MKRLAYLLSRMKWSTFAMLLLGAILVPSRTSRAGLTLQSSSGTSFYSLVNTSSPGPSNFAFNTANGELLAAGGGLPQLGALGSPPNQFSSQNTLVPSFTTNATNVPGSFGTASTQIYAATSGQEGGFTTQGGLFWSITTSVADNLGTSSSLASLSFSTATATFTNNGTGSVTLTPAAILSVTGTIGSGAGSYVAAGLFTTFSTTIGGVTHAPITIDPIVLAANNASGNAVRIASTGGASNEFGSLNVAGSRVNGTGTGFNPSSVTLNVGDSITISSALTLISDPNSSIGIVSGLPLGFPTDPSFVPMFGVFADALGAPVIPEPSSIVLLSIGMTMPGVWAALRRRRLSTSIGS
jgi:hypothetical protein